MDPSFLTLLTIFVGIAAVAILIQAGILGALYFLARRLEKRIAVLMPDVQAFTTTARRTSEKVEKHIDKIGASTAVILDHTKQQVVKVDELLNEAATRSRVQMERAEMVLDDAMTRTQETVALVQNGIVRPIREIHGILNGLRAALAYLGRGSRPTVDHATSDEEMFI